MIGFITHNEGREMLLNPPYKLVLLPQIFPFKSFIILDSLIKITHSPNLFTLLGKYILILGLLFKEVFNIYNYVKASARRVGLSRLWDWILSVVSLSLVPWRLVIGRLGRIGHGELRGWSVMLSRKSLKKAVKMLKVNITIN